MVGCSLDAAVSASRPPDQGACRTVIHAFDPKSRTLLRFLLALALLTIAAALNLQFQICRSRSISMISAANCTFQPPYVYLIGIVSNSVLPFTLACYLALNQRWWAGAVLVLMLLFIPSR